MNNRQDKLNLADAFKPEPEFCHEALMSAARSVREDKPVKKFSVKAFLIAACLTLLVAAVALAATGQLGWTDVADTRIIDSAREILESTETQSYEVGPMTFTVNQLLADKHVVLSSTQIRPTNGEKALMFLSTDINPNDAIADTDKGLIDTFGLDPDATWLEAANSQNVPLYSVRATLSFVDDIGVRGGVQEMYDSDGIIYELDSKLLNSSEEYTALNAEMRFSVYEIDTTTGAYTATYKDSQPIELSVAPTTETHEYTILDGEHSACMLDLKRVYAELTPAGLYIYTEFQTQDEIADIDPYDYMWWLKPHWLDENGDELPRGLTVGGSTNVDNWPTITLMESYSLDHIPQTLQFKLNSEADDIMMAKYGIDADSVPSTMLVTVTD